MPIIWEESNLTVAIEEMDGSPKETVDRDGFKATRVLKCAWTDRIALINDLVGFSKWAGGSYVIRRPHRYPANSMAFVRSCSPAPFGKPVDSGLDSRNLLAYNFALVTVEYDMEQPESYASEDFEASAEFITLPGKGLYWDSGQVNELANDEAPGKIIVMGTWVFRRDKMPYLPVQILNYVGYVNQYAIISPKWGTVFAAETLLWTEPALHEEKSSDGTSVFSMEFRMMYRPQGWNKFPKRGETITFAPIYNSGGSVEKPYPQADFLPVLMMTI